MSTAMLGAARGGDGIDEPVDDLADERTKTVGRLRRERRGDQPAQARVHVALGAEDVDALAREERFVGDAHHLRDDRRRAVPPLVAEHGRGRRRSEGSVKPNGLRTIQCSDASPLIIVCASSSGTSSMSMAGRSRSNTEMLALGVDMREN